MTAREIESKNREFINHFSDEIADCRKAANKEAVEKLERIKSRLKIERDHGNKKVLYPIEYVEIDDFEGRSWIVKLLLLNHYIAEADTAIKYIRAIKPELAPPPPKDDPSPVQDEIDPQSAPNEATGELYAGLEWKADLADLAELIKGLFHAKCIQKNEKPIKRIELKRLFETLFNTGISDLDKSFRERMGTYSN